MKESPKDISYCRNDNCNRNCERNLKLHNLVGVYSVSQFDKVETYSENYCPYFIELEKGEEN